MDTSGGKLRKTASRKEENEQEAEKDTQTTSEGTLTPLSSTEGTPKSSGQSFVKLVWHGMLSGILNFFSGEPSSEDIRMGHNLFRREKLEDFEEGIPRLAAFVSSDLDIAIIRTFNTLHNRILVQDQVEITEIEKALMKMDKEDAADPKKSHYRLRRTLHKENWGTEKTDLLELARKRLIEYDNTALNHKRMQDLDRPAKRNFLSYWNFIWTTKPLADGYWDYVYWADDFATLSGSRTNPFQNLIQEHMFKMPWSPIKWLLRRKDKDKPTTNKAGTYYNDRTLNICSRAFMLSVAVGLLLIPANLLFLVPMTHLQMSGAANTFIVLFALLMLPLTKNVYAFLVATATFSAAIFTFLGNLGNSNNCSCAAGTS